MHRVLTCPEGGSITCSILNLVEEIGKEPGGFEWWADIFIPLLAAVASIGVLVFSVMTANSSRKQAGETERARVDAEEARVQKEHAEMMRRVFAAIFTAISELSTKLFSQAQEDRPDERTDTRVLAEIAVARLEAETPEEIRLIDRIRQFILESRGMDPIVRAWMVSEVWHLVILWHENDEQYRRSTVFPRFDELARVRKFSDVPAWVQR